MQISAHNVTKIERKKQFYDGKTNESGQVFHTVTLTIHHDEGAVTKLVLFSNDESTLQIEGA